MTNISDYIGRYVRDITGFHGVCTGYVESLSSMDRLAVQPLVTKEGEPPPAAYEVDVSLCSIDPEGKTILDKVITPVAVDINLGDEVQDIITGYRGIVTAKHTYINGCVSVTFLNQKTTPKGDYPRPVHLSSYQVTKVSNGLNTEDKPVADKPVTGSPRTQVSRPL